MYIGLFYFWSFNAYISVDFVKRGVLTRVGNDRYDVVDDDDYYDYDYYHYYYGYPIVLYIEFFVFVFCIIKK